jgi:hypothetical protein
VLGNSFARRTTEIEVDHDARRNGDSKYSFSRLISLMFDLVTSMTTYPLRLLSIAWGRSFPRWASGSAVSAAHAAFVRRRLGGQGVFTLFAILFIFVGAQFVGMGLLGEYLGRVYNDVRARPRYFIQRVSAKINARRKRYESDCTGLSQYRLCGHRGPARSRALKIAAVFTHRDDPNESQWFDSVAELASGHGIPVFAPENINHPLWVARSAGPGAGYAFFLLLSGHGRGERFWRSRRRGCLNLHGSLLPRYRGRCPDQLGAGQRRKETGVTLHYMTPRPDDGDIVGQKAIPISDEDTALTLHRKAALASGDLLDDLLPRIMDGTAPRTAPGQAGHPISAAGAPADGEIDWTGRRPGQESRAGGHPALSRRLQPHRQPPVLLLVRA